ncbi:MAG: hypothetical protein JO235_08570 [Chroococcidiopsidaceae cyanobacterium CP_BM_RX_35]|nr:hypothetical protein [Chroococcidiopsidaceae cyanobacterium CP_BM_RX_35]
MTNRKFNKITTGFAHLTKLTHLSVFAALVAMNPAASLAQSAVPAPPLDPTLVPTTKVLAIGSFTTKATPSAWKALVSAEMRQTAGLYLAGKIDQWYFKPDQSEVVFVLNVADPKEAHELLTSFPCAWLA